MTASISCGGKAIIAILMVLAVGYRFTDQWMGASFGEIAKGNGMGNRGTILQRSDEKDEGSRRPAPDALLDDPAMQEDRRQLALPRVTDLTGGTARRDDQRALCHCPT